jgi:hypothetical protein
MVPTFTANLKHLHSHETDQSDLGRAKSFVTDDHHL